MIIANISDVLLEVKHSLERKYELVFENDKLRMIYDHQLDFESGNKLTRSNSLIFNNDIINNIQQEKSFSPMLLFKRGALKFSNDVGRYHSIRKTVQSAANTRIFNVVYGQIELDFMFITNKISTAEAFEIFYWGENGIQSLKDFTLNYKDYEIGEVAYQMLWSDLSDFNIEVEGNTYKALTFTSVMKGHYFMYEKDGNIVSTIYLNLYGDEEKLQEITIV